MPISKTNSLLSRIDLSLLRHFFAVASFGGFSRAARAVGISQPALSQGLRKLESSLGVSLVDRDSKEFALTGEGHALFAFCRKLEGGLAGLVEDFGTWGAPVSRRLRIGTAFSIGFQPLSRICKGVATATEPIELELTTRGSYELVNELASGSLDAAVLPDEVHDPRIRLRRMGEDRVILVAGRAPARRVSEARNWREALISLPLLTYPRDTPMRYLVDRIRSRENLEFRTSISVNGLEAMKSLASQEAGVAFLMASLVESEMRSGSLAEISTSFALPKRGYVLATRKSESGEEISALIARISGGIALHSTRSERVNQRGAKNGY